MGLFSQEKKRIHSDLIVVTQYLKGAYKKDGQRLLTKACRHWNRLPSEIRDAPFKCRRPGWIALGAAWSSGRPMAGGCELEDL